MFSQVLHILGWPEISAETLEKKTSLFISTFSRLIFEGGRLIVRHVCDVPYGDRHEVVAVIMAVETA